MSTVLFLAAAPLRLALSGVRRISYDSKSNERNVQMFRIAILLAFACAVISAQETWGGLKFGMTETEVRLTLKGRAIKDIRELKSEQPVNDKLYAPIQVTDVKVSGASGKASLFFDQKTKRLLQIIVHLEFDQTATASARWAFESLLPESLSGKYGKPVVEFHCPVDSACSAKWRDGAQVIDLLILREVATDGRGIPKVAAIIYAPVSKPGDDI